MPQNNLSSKTLFSEIPVTVETARNLGLTDTEYALVLEYLGRTPTYTELGIFSVMWSEHCSYKNSILQLKTLPRSGGRMLVEAGEENAGLIDIGDGYAIAFKIESHNHPSAVEPFQGAATGVGGILRDIFTMGARPIAALNSLRFGNLDTARTKYLLKGVVHGISHYGNCFGVPTVGGEVYFDECYTDNPLVNAMAVGIVETGKTASAIAVGAGNIIMIMGSSTGRDGIHGASLLASREFDEKTADMRPTVQVGDPFAEKLLLEATLELIESGCVVGIQDMGAAGISCSTSEMSAKGNSGMIIDLDKVPLRESDMSAYEIMLSESQERMLVVVENGNQHIAKEICEKWDVPITQIGVVTDDGALQFYRHGKKVADLRAEWLVLGGKAPVYEREWREADYISDLRSKEPWSKSILTSDEIMQGFLKVLTSPTIASKRWIYEQYDSQVRTNTVSSTGDAAVMRIKELPGKGFAVSTDCNSRYVYLNPYKGGMIAVAEAARNLVCVGAEPVAITNCLNFGNPYDPEVYWQFREAIRGMGDACRMLQTPVTGGNVSFHNESRNHAVYPTPTIGMLGLIEDIDKTIGSGFISENDVVYLAGFHDDYLGGSEYCKQIYGTIVGDAPSFDLNQEVLFQITLLQAIRGCIVRTAHDCSEGGLLISLAECCIQSKLQLGADIQFPFELTAGNLFGESQSRAIVSVSPDCVQQIEQMFLSKGVPLIKLGNVTGDELRINQGVFSEKIIAIHQAYENSLPNLMSSDASWH